MINKTEIVNRFCEEYGTTKVDTSSWISAFVDILVEAIEEDDVKISGLGTFKYKLQAPRMVRDFEDGKSVLQDSRYKLMFEPSSKIKWRDCDEE